MRILGVADHPWQSEMISEIFNELDEKKVSSFVGTIVLADYYTPYHAPELIDNWRNYYPWTYHHMGDLYKSWQNSHKHLNLDQVEGFLGSWMAKNLPKENYFYFIKKNQYVNSYERSIYYQKTPLCCQKQILADTILWIEDIFTRERFDVVLGIERYTMLVSIIEVISQRKGITYLKAIPSRIENRWFITADSGVGMNPEMYKKMKLYKHKDDCKQRALAFVDNMLNQKVGLYARWKSGAYEFSIEPSDPIKSGQDFLFGDMRNVLIHGAKAIYSRLFIHSRKLQYRTRILDEKRIVMSAFEVIILLKKLLRSLGFKMWGNATPEIERDFYLWCLHYRPEGSTLVLSDGVDELEVISSVAKKLPLGSFLYVKENPAMFGMRSRKFYKAIHRIPNVIFVDAFCSTSTLLLNCKGVIGLSGTILLEALAYGKKSISLGKPEFDLVLPFRGFQQLDRFFNDEESCDSLRQRFIEYFCFTKSITTGNYAAENSPIKLPETQRLIKELSQEFQRLMTR